MNSQPLFPGFPSRLSFTPLPNLFFARLLPEIDSLTELKLILHIFWRLYQKRGAPKFVTYKELLGDKEKTREALEILLGWYRDLVFVKAGAEEGQLINLDRLNDLTPLARKYAFDQLTEIVAGVGQALKLLDENLNVKIAFYLLLEKIWVRS